MDTLKENFGGLKEEMSLIRHDLQKIWECPMAVEGRVNDVKDKMAPLIREAPRGLQKLMSLKMRTLKTVYREIMSRL